MNTIHLNPKRIDNQVHKTTTQKGFEKYAWTRSEIFAREAAQKNGHAQRLTGRQINGDKEQQVINIMCN